MFYKNYMEYDHKHYKTFSWLHMKKEKEYKEHVFSLLGRKTKQNKKLLVG